MPVVAADVQEGLEFFESILNMDSDAFRKELSRLSAVDFKDTFEPRSPYTPTYAGVFGFTKGADTALKCVAALVREITTAINRFNQYNLNKDFMEAFLETSMIAKNIKIIREDLAKIVYDAKMVLTAFKIDLLRFLEQKNFLQENALLNSERMGIVCRPILIGKEWWSTF